MSDESAVSMDTAIESQSTEATNSEPVSTSDSVFDDVAAVYDELTTETKQEAPSLSVEQPKVIERPISWPKESWEKFDALPEDLRELVLTREKERDTQINRKQQEFYNKTAPFAQFAQKYPDVFPTGEVDPQILDGLLELRRNLTTNPKDTINSLKEFLNVVEDDTDYDSEVHPQFLSEIQQLKKEISSLQEYRNNVEKSKQEEVYNSKFNSVINFASAKSESGELLYPFYKEVAEDMIPILANLRQSYPTASDTELLKDAYERATWSNKKVREKLLNATQVKSPTTSNSLSTRSSGGNRTSNSGKKIDPNNLHALVAAIYDGEI